MPCKSAMWPKTLLIISDAVPPAACACARVSAFPSKLAKRSKESFFENVKSSWMSARAGTAGNVSANRAPSPGAISSPTCARCAT